MIDLRVGRWETALADVGEVDAVILDAPYSDFVHAGHNAGSKLVQRETIDYGCFSAGNVRELVKHWSPKCKGWFVSITDHRLARVWEEALSAEGRATFAPLPWLSPGASVRFQGDGPSSWTCWIVVARPRNTTFSRWGALPGGYVTPKGEHESHATGSYKPLLRGQKPIWLMQALIRDYTRPGDLVCDPTAGGATTLIAAHTLGRRAIGAEMDPATAAKAQARIDRHLRQGTLFEPAAMAVQARLEV